MEASKWTYAAVIVSILSGLLGGSVAGYIFYRIWHNRHAPQVTVTWLLVVIAAMSFAQILEQSRVLMFRLSYDSVIQPSWFDQLYNASWHVVFSKLLFAVALAAGTGLKLALYCERTEREATVFSLIGAFGTVVLWVTVAAVIDWWS